MGKLLKNSNIFIFAVYLIFSIVFTYPLILKVTNHLLGWPLDGYLYLWNIDTFWHEISQLRNPFFTQRIFYPVGANLSLNSYAPLISLFGILFLQNKILYINLLILLALTFSAFAMHLFVKNLTKSSFSGFIAGLFYGFSPIIFSFLISQHYYFAFAAPFIPLSLLFLDEFIKGLQIKSLVKIIVVFWLTFFIDYYTSILIVLISIVYFLVRTLLNRKLSIFLSIKRLIKYLGVGVLGLIIPMLFLLYFVFGTTDLKPFLKTENFYPAICSAKPLGFIIPGRFSGPQNLDTPYYFLGWVTLLIAIVAVFKKHLIKITFPLSALGIFTFLLSLGPSTPLFTIFSKIPFMGLIDCPQRFAIGVQVAVATLVGIFAISKRKLVGILLVVFLLEYGTRELPLTKVEVPTIYKNLSEFKNNSTVLELPSGLTESKSAFGYDWSIQGLNSMQMYWQTLYQKPRVGGYISRIPKSTYDFFENELVISDLFAMTSLNGKWSNKVFSEEAVSLFIKKFNLGFIILSPNSRIGEFQKITEGVFRNFIANKTEQEGFILYTLKAP